MNEIINKMKDTLKRDSTLTSEQKEALRDFIQSWDNNNDHIVNEIKKL